MRPLWDTLRLLNTCSSTGFSALARENQWRGAHLVPCLSVSSPLEQVFNNRSVSHKGRIHEWREPCGVAEVNIGPAFDKQFEDVERSIGCGEQDDRSVMIVFPVRDPSIGVGACTKQEFDKFGLSAADCNCYGWYPAAVACIRVSSFAEPFLHARE